MWADGAFTDAGDDIGCASDTAQGLSSTNADRRLSCFLKEQVSAKAITPISPGVIPERNEPWQHLHL